MPAARGGAVSGQSGGGDGGVIGGAADPLGEAVRTLFSDLRLAGDGRPGSTDVGDDPGAQVFWGEAGRVEHGTRVHFGLWVFGQRVQRARYRAYGCPYTLACCEWLARRLCGAQLPPSSAAAGPAAEVLARAIGSPADWAATLAIPPVRLGRLLVIEDALRAALGGYLSAVAAPHNVAAAAHSSSPDESMTKPG
jgi:hypothetical protein